jgi:protein arginine N-methyltransferase 1
MYSLDAYGAFIANSVRMNAYRDALRRAVKTDVVVLDIGTGTGIFALLACKMGARRVYAVEPDDVIQVARDLAAANGYSDRIVFFQARSTEINLPERADVIVSDIRGVLPLFGPAIPAIIDARRRFLAPGGVLIPQSDTLWAAVVTAPRLYRRHLGVWGGRKFGLNWTAARELAINRWCLCQLGSDNLLVSPQCWGRLDYNTVAGPNLTGELTWEIDRPGTAHGLLLWFDGELAPGLGYSNAPGAPKLVYGQAFLPWPRPVALVAGDRVAVSLAGHLVGEDYLWKWDTRILEPGKAKRSKADFHQSTFFGMPLAPAILEKMNQSHLPELNEAGQIERFILEHMDGQSSLGEIARQVAARFPSRFAQASEALGRVQELSRQYSR